MIRCIFIFSLIIFSSASSAGKRESADLMLKSLAAKTCEKLGTDCEIIKRRCPQMVPMPNTCIVMEYFDLEVAKERCGVDTYMTCYQDNIRFKGKALHEFTLPNQGKPILKRAFKECGSVGYYEVKSSQLKNIEWAIIGVMNSVMEQAELYPPTYQDSKVYFDCLSAVK
ncbi:hypothetical protein [Pseudoalteromonas sp. McH1-42]|uniref:hypothetical protein n=1 Tax=Pseudoalteromonas sp. McH1-42 TaxID=2917752 RepID=UPI001EF5422E|nr:hypothetical protein [Pseudoalteromonas sp. McH1-42]MCG7560820.1 hypothetical protein [Pseudoalteromonas sp. McH1-42]